MSAHFRVSLHTNPGGMFDEILEARFRVLITGAKENPKQRKSRLGSWFEIGGPEGARTPDLHTASVALSQLSYRPMIWVGWGLRGQ